MAVEFDSRATTVKRLACVRWLLLRTMGAARGVHGATQKRGERRDGVVGRGGERDVVEWKRSSEGSAQDAKLCVGEHGRWSGSGRKHP